MIAPRHPERFDEVAELIDKAGFSFVRRSSRAIEWQPSNGTWPASRIAALASRFGIPLASPVDYWTEAALFADAGLPTIVFGPGSIAQAHAADEFVPLADLEQACAIYSNILSGR